MTRRTSPIAALGPPLLALLGGCGPEGGAAGPAAAAAPAAVFEDAPAAGSPEAARAGPRKAPLPPVPRDGAERLAGLVRLLESGDAPLVEFAGDALASFPDRDGAAAALREAIERGLRTNLSLAFNALGAVRDPALGERLADLLPRCFAAEDPNVRSRAVLAYSRFAPAPSLAAVAALAADGWAPVSGSACRALEVHRGPAAAAALREVLPRVGEFSRGGVLNALGRLGDPASVPLLRGELAAAREAGERATSSFYGALQSLARLGDAAALEELRRIVDSLPADRGPVPLDSGEAAWDGPEVVLAAGRDEGLRARLLLQARSAPADAAASAVRLLASAYPPDGATLAAFQAALERPDADAVLVAEALDALRRAGAADAVVRTLASLVHRSTERRYGAALALGRFRDPSTVKAMTDRLAAEEDASVARKVVDALGILADPSSAPALVRFLKSDPAVEPERALRAFEAGANLRGPMADAVAADLAALVARGPTPAIRSHAARALGRCSVPGPARPPLEALLRDPDPRLRAAAADALGDLGDPAARDALAGAYAREADASAWHPLRDAVLRLDLRNP